MTVKELINKLQQCQNEEMEVLLNDGAGNLRYFYFDGSGSEKSEVDDSPVVVLGCY